MKTIKLLALITISASVCSCGGGGGGDKPDGPITPSVVAVTSVSISKTAAELVIGNTLQLTATVSPSNATDKNVTWNSFSTTVATVSPTGLVTAKTEGSANITASCGGKSATCQLTVKKPVIPTPVSSVTLSQPSASLKVGETVTLTATVKPDDATDKTVTWSTSDGSVAIVSNGVVTAKKVGVATITAKAGEKSATCEITVTASGSGTHEGITEEDW